MNVDVLVALEVIELEVVVVPGVESGYNVSTMQSRIGFGNVGIEGFGLGTRENEKQGQGAMQRFPTRRTPGR